MPSSAPPHEGPAGQEVPGEGEATKTPKRSRPRVDPALKKTPPGRPKARPPAMKQKVDALIGVNSCLLMGLQQEASLQKAHWLYRELYKDELLFKRIEANIGLIVKLPNGDLVRVLHLDSPDNQENLSASAHTSFDGKNGFGSGSWCLLPVRLKPALARIEKNSHMSSRQWFPQRTHLYRVYVFDKERPLGIHRLGPLLRTYEHLECVTAEQLQADDVIIAAEGCAPDFVLHSDDPSKIVSVYTIDPSKPSTRFWIVRSHLNPANVLADAASKLEYRRKKGMLGDNDVELHRTIWPVVQHWFDDIDRPESDAAPVADEYRTAEEQFRIERRLQKVKTEPTKASSSRATAKKREAASVPAPMPSTAARQPPPPAPKRKR
ncbi:hypothetical protein HDZ31DRAFT_23482, partial [Schizophyllum fasciatum]